MTSMLDSLVNIKINERQFSKHDVRDHHWYRWVILFSSFSCRFLTFGTVFSTGVFNSRWQAQFHGSNGTTALVNSTAAGMILLIGPIGSLIVDRLGCRWGTVIGSSIAAMGYILSACAPSIPVLCLTFGVISGAGGGIANMAGVVVISQYFKTEVSMAQGIGSAGVGAGCFLLAILQEMFIVEYGWRGALLIMAGIAANLCIFGMMFTTPEEVLRLFPVGGRQFTKDKLDESKSDDTLPLKYDSSTDSYLEDFPEQLPIREYFYLWLDRRFRLLALSDFFSWLVQLIPYIHLPAIVHFIDGIDPKVGTSLLSSMGLFAAGGKIVFGSVCTWTKLSPLQVFIPAQALFGVVTILCPLCSTYVHLFAFSILFGFLSGSYTLMIVITQQTMGDIKFSAAYGSLLFMEALGVVLGPPLAGVLKDLSGDYNLSLYVAGSLLMVSAAVMLLLPNAKREYDNSHYK